LAAYRKGYYCTPSQPIAENVGTSMNEDDRSHKLGDFFLLSISPHTHTIYAVNIWTPSVSGCTIHQTFNDSNRSFKCGNKDVVNALQGYTQIIAEVSEYLSSIIL
jgi:hypothetical protein